MTQPIDPQLLAALQAKGIIQQTPVGGPQSQASPFAQWLAGAITPTAGEPVVSPLAAGASAAGHVAANMALPGFGLGIGGGGGGQAAAAPQGPQSVPPGQTVNFNPQAGASGQGGPDRLGPLQPQGGAPQRKFQDVYSPQVTSEYNQAAAGLGEATKTEGGASLLANEGTARAEEAAGTRVGERAGALEEAEKKRWEGYQKVQEHVARYQREADEGKIDYHRWWNGKKPGEKALLTVGNILQRFAMGWNHEQGATALEQAAARDVNEQREELEGKRTKAKEGMSLLKDMRDAFGDERLGEQAATAIRLQQYDHALRADAQRAQSPMLVARAAQTSAAMAKTIADIHAGLQKAVTVGGGAIPNENAWVDKRMAEEKGARSIDDLRQEYRSIYGGRSPTGASRWGEKEKSPEEKGKAHEQRIAIQSSLQDIDQMIALRQRHNGGSLSPEERAKGQALAAAGQERRLAGLGRVNSALLQRVQHLIPDNPLELNAAGLVGSDPTMAKMQEARRILQGELSLESGEAPKPDVSHLQTPIGGKQ